MKDRVVQYPNRYEFVEVSPGVYDLIPKPGVITEQGTPINKATLLTDATATNLGLSPSTGTVDKALEALTTKTKTLQSDITQIESDITQISLNLVPRGVIVAWSGSSNAIPSGWALCNGSNGTPDLRDRFIVGAGSSYAVGNTGGSNTVTLTTNQIPSHNHQFVITRYTNQGGYLPGLRPNGSNATTYTSGVVDAEPKGNTYDTGGGQAHENRPPYYALCWIMKL